MLLEIAILLVITWLIERRWRLKKQLALGKQLKTSLKSYPIIGHSLMFIGTDEDRMRTFEAFGREAIKAGGITQIWLPNELFICVADAVAADCLLSQCLEKHEIAHVVKFLIGDCSLYASVPVWRARRKKIVPAFISKNVSKYVEIFSKQSTVMIDLMQKEVGENAFSFRDYVSNYNLNISCETTLGININSQRAKNHELKSAIDEMCEIAAWRICQPWFRNDFVFKLLPYYHVGIRHRTTFCDFLLKIIEEKHNLYKKKKSAWKINEETNSDMTSFLDLQLEAPEDQKLTDKELLEEIMLLVLASYDTSTTALGFTALMLSRHPDVQEKICKELIEVLGESDSPLTARDLAQLKYLDAVIKESLRLFPPVPLLVRRVDKDVTLPSGVTIVKDCGILLNVWAIHRNPSYWGEDVDSFRPERFLNLTLEHSTAFIPFSAGLRNCIGIQFSMLSMKTVILSLLRRYKLLPPPGVKNEEPVRTKYDLMLRHVDNFKIQLENRV